MNIKTLSEWAMGTVVGWIISSAWITAALTLRELATCVCILAVALLVRIAVHRA